MKFRSLLSAIFVSLGFSLILQADDKAAAMKTGETKYAACAACHGKDGKGIETSPGLLIATNFTKSPIVKGNPEWMALIVMKGLQKEDNRYLGVKTPLETSLNDAELAAILTYIRNTWGGCDDLVTATQVSEWRKKYAEMKQPPRQADIAKRIEEEAKP